MCEKMEELKPTPRPLSLNDGWDQQVNGKAQRTDDQMEMEKRYWAAQRARLHEIRRAKQMLSLVALALIMIATGGVFMFHMKWAPLWVSASVAVGGVATLFFLLGMAVGRSRR